MGKIARAEVSQLRQTTQYTCTAASIAAACVALDKNVSEDDVNRVLGAIPMAGATWEAMLATVQYFGLRGSLVVPATPKMLKTWTDQGLPVVIAWNPEGRPWSHASTVYNVTEGPPDPVPENCTLEGVGPGLYVWVADANIPNPAKTTRIVQEDSFCQRWGEKISDSLIMRRPAMLVAREIDAQGRQVVASSYSKDTPMSRQAKNTVPVVVKDPKDKNRVVVDKEDLPKNRVGPGIVQMYNRKTQWEDKRDKPKNKDRWKRDMEASVAEKFLSENEE